MELFYTHGDVSKCVLQSSFLSMHTSQNHCSSGLRPVYRIPAALPVFFLDGGRYSTWRAFPSAGASSCRSTRTPSLHASRGLLWQSSLRSRTACAWGSADGHLLLRVLGRPRGVVPLAGVCAGGGSTTRGAGGGRWNGGGDEDQAQGPTEEAPSHAVDQEEDVFEKQEAQRGAVSIVEFRNIRDRQAKRMVR
jgi:hypothetical protein